MSEETANDTAVDESGDEAPQKDPVRKWTFIVLALCLLLMAYCLVADRATPFTSQARVNALVVPIAAEVSGTVTDVYVIVGQLDVQRRRLDFS